MFRFLAAGTLLAFALSGCIDYDFDSGGGGDTAHLTIHQHFVAAPHLRLSVSNVSGDIMVAPWNRQFVDILAVKRGASPGELRRIGVEIDKDTLPASDVTITTHYRHAFFGDTNGSVYYTIHVPKDASVRVNEVSGDVVANALGGNVDVHSVSGDVTVLRTGGNLSVHSVSGDVDASMLRMDSGVSADVNTVSGSIHLSLPRSAGATVDAGSVSGGFSSPWPIPTRERMVGVSAGGTIGNGGGNVSLKSVSGDIQLERTP